VDYGFIWTDGSPSDYEYWSNGEPNDWNGSAADCTGDSSDGGNEDCTEIQNNRGGQWNDVACDAGGRWYWCSTCPTHGCNPDTYLFVDDAKPFDFAVLVFSNSARLHSDTYVFVDGAGDLKILIQRDGVLCKDIHSRAHNSL
jgi:hypothetical protein